MLSEITLSIIKYSFTSLFFFPDLWNLANVLLSEQKLCGHLQLSVKTLKINTNCAIIRNQLAKIFQKARTSNSLKLYLSYYMLEWPLEQQIALQLMQTLSSFSTSLVSAQTSNEAPLDPECVQSSDKTPQYAKKLRGTAGNMTTVAKKCQSFLYSQLCLLESVCNEVEGSTLDCCQVFVSKGNIFIFEEQSSKVRRGVGESLFCFMDYSYFPLKTYLISGGKITDRSFVFR